LEKIKIFLVLATLSLIWGSSFLAIKVVIDVIPPLLTFGIRFIIAGIPLLFFYKFIKIGNTESKGGSRNRYKIFNKKRLKVALVLGAFIVLGGQGLLVWGAQYLSSGMTALLNSTIPLWVAIFASMAFKQHLTKDMVFGLVAGFSGLIILINPFTGNDKLSLVGIISLTLSSIFWAIGSLYSTKNKDTENVFASGGMLMIVGGIMLIITSFLVGEFYDLQLSKITLNIFLAYLFLIFLCTSVGYAEFFWLLQVESSTLANSFAYIVPVIAVFLGWAVFNENISITTIIATAIIIIGVALMIKSPSNSSNNLSSQKAIKKSNT
jgi:drug/metabolite transporter (DMT)-like permease